MKRMLAVAALATTVMAGSVLPSMAATYSSTVTIDPATMGGGSTVSVAKGAFTIDFNFVTTMVSSIDAIISNARTTAKNAFVTFTSLKIISGSTVYASTTTQTLQSPGPGVTIQTSTSLVPSGNFTAEVMGTAKAAASISSNISLSPVPLPNSVALFGTAVLGLGLVGAARRKSKSAAAV